MYWNEYCHHHQLLVLLLSYCFSVVLCIDLIAEEVDRGIGAVEYLRKQQSVQHLPDRAELDAGVKTGGYVSSFINKAQVKRGNE